MISIALNRLSVKIDSRVEILSFSSLPTRMMVKICLLCILFFVAVGMRETDILKRILILITVSNRANFLKTAVRILPVEDPLGMALDLTSLYNN